MLREARTRSGLTQTQVAQAVGVSRSLLARFESGIRLPTVRTFFRLVEALGLSASEALALGRELVGLPAPAPVPALEGLPLHLDGKRVELVKLYEGPNGVRWAMVRPFGSPTAPALHLPVAGLSLTPIPAVRAA